MEKLDIKVNGKDYSILINPSETLAEVLRNRLQLTGTKIGCEQGSCGACTVLEREKPILSCISPALRHNGSEITTVEGLAKNNIPDILQKHFMYKGALQCGFCTPGMLMSAKALLNRNVRPTREEIAEAISGNMCRCTGYKKIIDAIESAACELRGEPFDLDVTSDKDQKHVIGTPRPLIESEEKVRGSIDYADDIVVKNALHCKFVRSMRPHAWIDSIDTSAAEKLPGVRAVITGKSLPGRFGVLPVSQDQTALAVDKTRYIGEIVAAVAADTEAIAIEACKLIRVNYRALPEFLTIKSALEEVENENELIHPVSKKYKRNIHKIAELRFGEQETDFENADFVAEGEFEFAGLNHAFTEPHACTAWWDKSGDLTIVTATQVPHYLHRALSKVLETPLSRIRVIKPAVGGGFGGKSDPFAHEIIACALSKMTGQPVRVRLNREEVFLTNHGRHPTALKMKLALDADHRISTVDADIKIDGGAFGSFGVVTTYYNGVLLQAPYNLKSFGFRTRRVYTNKPPSGAMRGHGAVNPRVAFEVLLDELAEQSGIDPGELRLKNFLRENTITLGEYRITSNGSRDALEKVIEISDWNRKHRKLPFGKGVGIASGFFISGSALPIIWNEYPQSVVHLKLDFDGRVVVYTGASDIGQGSDTVIGMIVAEVLQIPMEKVFVHAADTLFTPVDLGSYSSRVTFMAGNAAKMAAEKLRDELIGSVSKKKGINTDELHLCPEGIYTSEGIVTWMEAVDMMTAGRGAVNTSGYYVSPKLGGDFKGSGAGLSPSYSFGAAVAEVEVDPLTGQVRIIDFWGAHDCGKALNPLAVEGQLEGSWHMGMGQALTEQMIFHEGLLTNSSLLDYKIPTSKDIPEMHTHYVETIDPEGPFGAKECGEGAIHPVIPAILNAIYDAVGVRIRKLPVSPEDILEGIKKNEATKITM